MKSNVCDRFKAGVPWKRGRPLESIYFRQRLLCEEDLFLFDLFAFWALVKEHSALLLVRSMVGFRVGLPYCFILKTTLYTCNTRVRLLRNSVFGFDTQYLDLIPKLTKKTWSMFVKQKGTFPPISRSTLKSQRRRGFRHTTEDAGFSINHDASIHDISTASKHVLQNSDEYLLFQSWNENIKYMLQTISNYRLGNPKNLEENLKWYWLNPWILLLVRYHYKTWRWHQLSVTQKKTNPRSGQPSDFPEWQRCR